MSESALAKSAERMEKERADLRAKMHDIEKEMFAVKGRISSAKSEAATKGKYLPPDRFRAMEQRLASLGIEKAALQTQTSELSRHIRKAGGAAGNEVMEAILDRLDIIVDHLTHSCEQCHNDHANE